MSDSLRKKIVFVAFIAVAIWGYTNFRQPHQGPIPQESVVAGNEQAPDIRVNTPSRPVNIEEKSKEPWGIDPFHLIVIPATKENQPATSLYWQLSGIIYTNQSQTAIINEKPVQIGETIDNAKVISIDKDQVVLEADGVRMTLTVSQG
ncbi:MAG TPA: type II secretion system protein N [candidate division Zixibacteria bacterium]|nr:type II secretion system protein N [candidate division Zixibacteria bacterium]